MFILTFLVFLGLSVADAHSATALDKYVNCATGDNNKDGSSGSPWRTIAKAAATANGGDVVHITAGPCTATNVSFGSRLTAPGSNPNCRSSDSQCTIFRGEPLSAPVAVTTTTSGSDGFLINGGVAHLKIQNFSFQVAGALIYNEPVKILGGQPSDIYLKDISVTGLHDSGIKVLNCHDILIEGGSVQGTTGDGYQIQGSTAEPTSNVVFRGAQSISNGKDGFTVPSAGNEVSNLTFDRTVSQSNGSRTTDDGYDIQGSAAVPSQTPIARFLDASAISNNHAGFKVWSSAQFENVYAAQNGDAGLAIFMRTGVSHTKVTVLNSTVKNNASSPGGSPQVNVAQPGTDLALDNTLVTGNQTILLKYYKGYTGTESGGGLIDWRRDLQSRTGAGGVIVRYFDRIGGQHDCTSAQNNLGPCDATGDCNFDRAVTIDEINAMTNIAFGNVPLSSCYQGDQSGDGQITVDEILIAANIALTGDAHNATVTSPPSFQPDGRHLVTGGPGSNAGLTPSSSFGVPMCRADFCDADSHARPDGAVYDIGAYEGTGQQGTSSTCANVAPGQCLTSGALAASPAAVAVSLGSVSLCRGGVATVPVVMTGSAGAVAGLQVDILYDTTTLKVPYPDRACTLAIPGYRGTVYTGLPSMPPSPPGRGRLRVLIADLGSTRDLLDDGTLVTCEFEVLADAVDRYGLSAERLIISSPAGEVLHSTLNSGQVDVQGACGITP